MAASTASEPELAKKNESSSGDGIIGFSLPMRSSIGL